MALFFYIFLTTISNCLISILPPATPTKRGLETLGGVLVIFYFALWQWSWNAEWFGGMDGCRESSLCQQQQLRFRGQGRRRRRQSNRKSINMALMGPRFSSSVWANSVATVCLFFMLKRWQLH